MDGMIGTFAAGMFITIALGGIAVAIFDTISEWTASHHSHGMNGENKGEGREWTER